MYNYIPQVVRYPDMYYVQQIPNFNQFLYMPHSYCPTQPLYPNSAISMQQNAHSTEALYSFSPNHPAGKEPPKIEMKVLP